MSRFGRLSLVLVVVSALALSAAAMAGTGQGLRTSLGAEKWRFESSERIAVTYTITNDGPGPILVLRWDTPVDGIEANILHVERDGEPVPYVGKLVKRAVPQPDDYLELAPGESMTFTFDPSEAYDMSAAGRYTLRSRGEERRSARGAAAKVDEGFAAEEVHADGAVALYFAGRERPGPEVGTTAKPGGGGTTKYNRCTTAQQSTLVKAESNATTRSGMALSYLQKGNSSTDSVGLYKTWFDNTGRYSPLYGWGTVTDHYSKIYNAFSSGKATFDCGCNQNYYAYVYANKPYNIFVCKVFWSASADTFPDTQAGTLIHEMSHFTATAGTNDWAYGTTNAKNFANTDPSKATSNADNHEYFAETQK
jgi:peptidyl-Lys metalloendopeptidase